MFRYIALFAGALGLVGVCSAQTLYNNTSNDNSGYSINGATDGSGNAVIQNGSIVTNTDFEEIKLAPGYAGLNLANISTDLYNSNQSAVTTQVWIQLYNDDGVAGAPGTEFFNYDGTITLGAGLTTGFGFNLLNTSAGDISGLFPLPADGNLWMSIAFAAPSTGDAGLDNAMGLALDNLSPGVGGTPTVGTTYGVDTFAFSSGDTNGDGYLFADNPQQVQWANDVNFGFEIDGTPNGTPEPFTMALGVAGIGLAIRRRVKGKTSK